MRLPRVPWGVCDCSSPCGHAAARANLRSN